ncbi:peptidylprolyl isomerase [Pseudomonas sp. Marseille-QA0892]
MKIKLCDFLRPALLSAMLVGSTLAHAQVQPLDRVVAIVDNDVVMQSQLDQRVREVQQTIARREGGAPDPAALRGQVLDRLIVENIQLQLGARAGIRISDDELNQAMETIAQRNNMTLDQFRGAVARDGLSYEQAREQVRREMIISRVRQRQVGERIQVSDQELQNFMASDLGRMHLSDDFRLANILIPVPDGASTANIQDAEARAQQVYRQLQQGADFGQLAIANSAGENAFDGGEIGWRKAAQLPAPFDNMVGSMSVGDVTQPVRTPGGFIMLKVLEKRGAGNQVRDEVHVRHILIKPSEIRSEQETQKLIERLYQRIQNGEDFATLAKSFSEDPGSALNGGDLNWVDPSNLVPEFRQVMEQAPQGQLSRPFQTQFGWHILEVLGRRATDASDDARRQQALTLLRNRKYDEELQNWLGRIRDEAYVEIKK